MNERHESIGAVREATWRAWMASAQAGDGDAYEKLLRDLLPYARRKVSSSGVDAAAREDIVQNALISMHRARHTYRSERPFEPWLHAILRNAIIDWLRSRGRRMRYEVSLEDEGVAEPAAAPAISLPGELSPELSQALAALPAKQREAVELIHLEGLSVAEAAARAGITTGALKVRAHRGYRALRAKLARRET